MVRIGEGGRLESPRRLIRVRSKVAYNVAAAALSHVSDVHQGRRRRLEAGALPSIDRDLRLGLPYPGRRRSLVWTRRAPGLCGRTGLAWRAYAQVPWLAPPNISERGAALADPWCRRHRLAI